MRIAAARYRAALGAGAPHGSLVYYERALAKAVADRIARAAPDGPEEIAAATRVHVGIEKEKAREAAWRRRFMPSAQSGDGATPGAKP